MEKEWKIEGQGMYLRQMREEDTHRIIKWRNSAFVCRNFIYRQPFTVEGHKDWVKTMIDTGKAVQFVIFTEEGRPIGSVYLRDIDRIHKKAEYGIFIGEQDALGRGYGTQAARLMLRYAFEQLKLHKVMLRVLSENEQARASYKKAGFVQEAYLKDEVFLEGKYHDIIYMAVINEEDGSDNGR